jgi:zinc protease
VVQKKLALDAGAFYDPDSFDLAEFGFYATPRKGIAVADFETAFAAEIKSVLKDGLTQEEVDRAKRRLQLEAVYARDSLDGPARIIGAALGTGRSLAAVEAWPQRIGAVTLSEVDAAARLVIHDDIAVTGILLPEPTS